MYRYVPVRYPVLVTWSEPAFDRHAVRNPPDSLPYCAPVVVSPYVCASRSQYVRRYSTVYHNSLFSLCFLVLIMSTNSVCSSYFHTYIPPSIQIELQAGAYESLCRHLQERSDEVSNIDLMTSSGFCRNCLAKWLVLEARKLGTALKKEQSNGKGSQLGSERDLHKLIRTLDAFGYDEAAEHVCGCTYPEWKKRFQKKATEDQL